VEQQFIDWLMSRLRADSRLDVPNGDDAAVLRPPAGRRIVFCTDILCEGVHFPRAPEYQASLVGHKAIAVNLSDIAAMGGRPEVAVASVSLPQKGGQQVGEELLSGMLAVADRFGLALVGGDTTAWDGPLVINVAMLGSVAPGRVWRRDGCRAGDVLLLTGAVGGSLARRHLSVEPRVEEARVIAETVTVHGAIDVSDGLALDLSRLVQASNCGAEVDLASVPVHADAEAAARAAPSEGSPLMRALGDGEDFELLMSVAADEAERLLAAVKAGQLEGWPGTSLTVIGRVVDRPGLVAVAADGRRSPLVPTGYQHVFT